MKQQSRVEQMLLAHPQGLTHRELALHLGMPEPSARRALQAVRAGRPRFKAGKGMFDIVEHGTRGVHKVFKVEWRAAEQPKDEPADFDAGSERVA